jgi:hypothetical protein
VHLYRYFVSQSGEFCRVHPLCCFSTSVYYCCLFSYRLSPETFGYALIYGLSIPSKKRDLALWCLYILYVCDGRKTSRPLISKDRTGSCHLSQRCSGSFELQRGKPALGFLRTASLSASHCTVHIIITATLHTFIYDVIIKAFMRCWNRGCVKWSKTNICK